jgi:hypothetical protein
MPMRFPYLKAARVKLQERKNACVRSSYETAEQYIGFFLNYLRTDTVIRTIHAELSLIAQQKFADTAQLVDPDSRALRLPTNETDCAAFQLRALEVQGLHGSEIPGFDFVFGNGSHGFQDAYDDFYGQVLAPLCSYIDERIDDGDLMLYMLSRYQRECTWFEADELVTLAKEADSRKVEEVLDRHLRTWLFREGIDYPFSTPKSPSGRADVIVWQGEEPLAIEVKVYDGEDRDLGHVSQGLWQAQRYAHDYGKPFGYLVVFNTSSHLLSFENNVAKDGPPCIVVGGLNVFAIVVNVGTARESASKEKPIPTKIVLAPTGG